MSKPTPAAKGPREFSRTKIPTNRRPTSPGEILVHEFLQQLGITQAAFAKHIGITNARLSEIIHGKRAVTMDTALRFERALGFSAEAWMRMQLAVDMYDATHGPKAKAVSRIKLIKPNDALRDGRRRSRAA